MITKCMVKTGYNAGLIQLISSPNGDGITCSIGDYWFYFGGLAAEEASSVSSYMNSVPVDSIIDEIYDALDNFRKDGIFYLESAEEYKYYELFLKEHGVLEELGGKENKI